MRYKHLIFLLFISLGSSIFAQLSKKHYIPPLTSSDGFTDQYIYISTPKNSNVSYKITAIGQPDLAQYSGVVSNGSPVEQAVLDNGGAPIFFGETQLHVSDTNISITQKFTDKGFIVEASDVIYVSVRVRSSGGQFHAGALVSKGSAAPGTRFRIGGFVREINPTNNHSTFASIMALEDNTTVDLSDLPSGATYPTGTPIPTSVVLNENETFVVVARATMDPRDIIGKLITSDKPIVVNSGSTQGSFGNSNGQDYGFDQIVGADKIGTEYITVKGDGANSIENVLIIADENNTEIFINGSSVSTINAGERFVAEGTFYNANGNMYINTSKNVFVYQGIGQSGSTVGAADANQSLFFVPPLSCENIGDVDNIPNIDTIGGAPFPGGVTIVTNNGANVTINDNPITSTVGATGPFAISGNSNYVTYRVTGLSGNVSVKSDKELYCAYFNISGAATTGAFFSGFPSPPEINFNTTVSTLGNCIPNVTLTAASTDLFDSFEWQYYNDATNTWENRSTNADYKPLQSEPGRYRLLGVVNCTGKTFESVEIPVSLCPDDYDNDLIIDNEDVDLDNDGILNSDESYGNLPLNLADVNNVTFTIPSAVPQTQTVTSAITKDIPTSSITGDTAGNFTATIDPNGGNSNLNYTLDFTSDVNIKFTQTAAATNNNDVFYIVKIGPNSKNITLLDPDNQLLVDTNFDGDFSDPITATISSSEIHFKIDPAATGPYTYEFVANRVDSFSFEMRSNGLSAASAFSGNIELTSFAKDSDGDGIEDALDLDSDNDGILDLFESAATSISLTGTDTNLDGLDDIFDSVATNVDTDGDGIPNYVDVDSDNDGIFDLTEAGHGNADVNFDGILDNANATSVGTNGLLDTLETTVDSGSLNYTVVDTDGDNLFNFVELDSDDDACFDVIEAGFTGNGSGILAASPFAVNTIGKVINNTDGYTTPNPNYITSAPIVINSFPDFTFCENLTDTMTIDSTADTWQWQVSTDSGVNWSNVIDDATYSGANTANLQITTVPLTFTNYQYRVLLSRAGNSCINQESNAITLTVNPEPIVTPIVPLKQCDTNADLEITFNLTEAEISITTDANATFEYFATEADAIAGAPLVTDETAYFVNTTGEAWVRTYTPEGCYIVSKIELFVSYTPNNPYNDTLPAVCDDLLDADGNDTLNNSDTDGISSFDLSAIPALISTDPDVVVEFYETLDDRTRSINEITSTQSLSNYRNKNIPNTTGTPFPIYYKLTSLRNNDCQGLGEFYLQIVQVPTANVVTDIEECDDALSGSTVDGRIANVNLRDKVVDILGPSQSEVDYGVTFHTSQAGATDGISDVITNDTSYTSVAQPGFTQGTTSEQTIYVRVQSRVGTACYNANTSFKIIVQPIPTVSTTITDLPICDVATVTDSDPRNRNAQNIDLTVKDAEILDGRTNYVVEYYIRQSDAETRTNRILDPTNFENTVAQTTYPSNFTTDDPGVQTIFFVVVDGNGLQCPSVFSTFNLVIHPEPATQPITVLSDCDNDDDGDDTNGIIQDIDLNGKIPEILGAGKNPNDYTVTFHTTPADAASGANPLPSPYENQNRNETVYVRVQNNNSSCVNSNASFDIVINELPRFTVTTPQILCLNDLPLNIFVENPADAYGYTWTDANGTILGTSDNLDITTGGSYDITATNTVTGCSRTRRIVINESNVATLDPSFVTIVDESNNLGASNSLSISIDTINNDLGPGDYQFAILNTETNTRIPFIGFQDDPLFEGIEGGIYQIIVNDKNGCVPDATLLVSVLQFPKFFTPNGDSQNDFWVIKGTNKTFYPNSSINIFNRYGKLVAQMEVGDQGWDGTFNGRLLPSDDYWYHVILVPSDPDKPRIDRKGNFSLLRR